MSRFSLDLFRICWLLSGKNLCIGRFKRWQIPARIIEDRYESLKIPQVRKWVLEILGESWKILKDPQVVDENPVESL